MRWSSSSSVWYEGMEYSFACEMEDPPAPSVEGVEWVLVGELAPASDPPVVVMVLEEAAGLVPGTRSDASIVDSSTIF